MDSPYERTAALRATTQLAASSNSALAEFCSSTTSTSTACYNHETGLYEREWRLWANAPLTTSWPKVAFHGVFG